MDQINFGRWRLEYDVQATRQASASIANGAPESCGCLYCRNFIAARDRAYPPEALQLFDRLGIDPAREAEVYQLAKTQPGRHFYGGFFHFVGQIVRGADALSPSGAVELEPMNEWFSLGFTAAVSLIPSGLKDLPVVQLEFMTTVAWVLPEPEPD